MKIVTPASEADLIESIREAIDKAAPLQVQGNGSRAGLGRPASGSTKLSMAELSGITLLEPAEMVFSAKAGTPVAVVEAALAEHGQALTFEPMDHRPLYGSSGQYFRSAPDFSRSRQRQSDRRKVGQWQGRTDQKRRPCHEECHWS